jgi:hypothetical protein
MKGNALDSSCLRWRTSCCFFVEMSCSSPAGLALELEAGTYVNATVGDARSPCTTTGAGARVFQKTKNASLVLTGAPQQAVQHTSDKSDPQRRAAYRQAILNWSEHAQLEDTAATYVRLLLSHSRLQCVAVQGRHARPPRTHRTSALCLPTARARIGSGTRSPSWSQHGQHLRWSIF